MSEREPGDLAELERRARAEANALQRDRYRAVLLAVGGADAPAVAAAVGRSRRAVQAWAYAYRDGGVDALVPARRPGRSPKLPRGREAAFLARMDAGPADADGGACTLRGRDAVRIPADEFKVAYTLDGAYDLLHRLGYSCLVPRPVHEKNDPAAAAAFKASGPFFVDAVTGPLGPAVRRARTFFMDEARFGQQGTLTKVWARRGTRPVAVRQTRYEWCYLYAAVEPATGGSAALVAPNVDPGAMNRFLEIVAAERAADEHLVPILDQAGWHTAKGLVVPAGVSLLFLPACSPEPNPVENLWHYLRDHYLSNRAYADYDAPFDAGTDAYRRLTPAVLKTVCGCPYLATRTD